MVSYFSEHAPSTEKINPSRDNLHESQRVDQTFKLKNMAKLRVVSSNLWLEQQGN